MPEIDITTTSVIRPEILDITLSSFKKHLFRDRDCRLILNIDPVGHDIDAREVFAVAQKYFTNTVYRIPTEPDFSKAFIWCWQQVRAPFVFHLEDDWELLKPVDLDAMLAKFDELPDLGGLRLHWKDCNPECKPFVHILPYNAESGFCEPVDDQKVLEGVAGHPTLFRGEFVREMVAHMVVGHNPEKQMRKRGQMPDIIRKYRWGVWCKPGDRATVREIGRPWIAQSGWRKQGSKAFFLRWERDPGHIQGTLKTGIGAHE